MREASVCVCVWVGGEGGVCPDVARKSGFCCQLNGQTQLKWPQTPFIYSSTIFNWSAAEMEEHTHTHAHTYTHKHAHKHTNTPGTTFKLHFLVVLYQQRKIPQSGFWWFHLTEHRVTKPEVLILYKSTVKVLYYKDFWGFKIPNNSLQYSVLKVSALFMLLLLISSADLNLKFRLTFIAREKCNNVQYCLWLRTFILNHNLIIFI